MEIYATPFYFNDIFVSILTQKQQMITKIGNHNTRMLLLASWHSCYRFGAGISGLLAVFLLFDAIICSLIYLFQSLVFIQ